MTYYQFIHAVEGKVKEEVEENITVGIQITEKNNGVKRRGITITEKGINISPTIYLEEYYQQFRMGSSLDKITKDILSLYNEVRFRKSWDEEKICTYEAVKDRIVYRLVNRGNNEKLLKEVPYLPYLDLAIVFYVLVEVTEYGTATLLIRNDHLDMWKTTKEEVYKNACENTWKLLPYEFQAMFALIEEVFPVEWEGEREILYVLSNRLRSFGAAAVLYEERLEMIGEVLGENYYVLPSSVHEVIIIPESDAPGQKKLSEIVTEINETQVDDEEVLSNNAYYYDREKRELVL